jgi:hypothetical protein
MIVRTSQRQKVLMSVVCFFLYNYLFFSFYEMNVYHAKVTMIVIFYLFIGYLISVVSPLLSSQLVISCKRIGVSLLLGGYWSICSAPGILDKNIISISFFMSIIYSSTIVFYVINYFSRPFNVSKIARPQLIGCICFMLLFMVWMGYFFIFQPGIFTTDSYSQFAQINGLRTLSSHHPLLHTAFMAIFVENISLYFVAQITISSSSIALILYFYMKNGLPVRVVYLVTLFFVVYPLNGLYLMTFWKDIFYAISLLWLTYLSAEACRTDGRIFNQKKFSIAIFVVLYLTMNLRNNGFYIVIILLPCFFIFLQYCKRIIVVIAFILLGLNVVSYQAINHLFVIEKPSIAESFAIPLQQIAYTLNQNDKEVVEEAHEFFETLLPREGWGKYQPYSVDAIKFQDVFNAQLLDNKKGYFLKYWFSTLRYNLNHYIDAYILHTQPLWQIYRSNMYVYIGQIESVDKHANMQRISSFNSVPFPTYDLKEIYKKYRENFSNQKVRILSYNEYINTLQSIEENISNTINVKSHFIEPTVEAVFSFININNALFANGGIVTFILIILSVVAIMNRKFLGVLPLVLHLVTLFVAAPASDFRYVFPILFSLPIAFIFLKCHNTELL